MSVGKLTEEQVRKAMGRNFVEVAVIDGGGKKVELREGWTCDIGFDFQAMADELNAALGLGECELHECEGSFSTAGKPVWRCDCGAFMTQYTDATTCHKPRFCPNCRRAVKL